jgi:hypothetical protein
MRCSISFGMTVGIKYIVFKKIFFFLKGDCLTVHRCACTFVITREFSICLVVFFCVVQKNWAN